MKRDLTHKLQTWKESPDRKPLVLRGARQVGKTYILKHFGEKFFPRVHYLNFETDETLAAIFEKNLKPDRIIQEFSFYLDASIGKESDLLILDEIQECPRALTSLKYFSESMQEMAICAAGSLLGIQLGRDSYPVGKVDYLEMHPMSFSEFLDGSDQSRYTNYLRDYDMKSPIPEVVHSLLWEQLKLYFIVGGLPEIVKIYASNREDLYRAMIEIRERQYDLIRDYVADIAKHSGKQNAMHMERIWKNIPSQLAREQNGSVSKFRFKGVVPGVNSYSRLAGAIDWLDAAGLILKVPIVNCGHLPFSAYGKENRFKLFCFDVGILGAVSRLPPKTILDYDYGSYKGYFAENFVAQEFRYSGIENICGWREGRAEVEFLKEENGEVFPIEVKSGWVTQAKSLKVFSQKHNPPYRTILSAKNTRIDSKNRVHRYPLYLAAKFPYMKGNVRAEVGDILEECA